MSFIHIVTYKWTFPDQSAKAAAAADALRAFVANLDGVESCSDIGLTPSSYDFAVVGIFTTQSDFESYRDHPQHQRIISERFGRELIHS
jgi:hypothetical protein